MRLRQRPRLTQEEHYLGALAGLQLEFRLQYCAGVQPRAHTARQRTAQRQCRGTFQRAMPPEEFAPIAAPIRLLSGQVRKGDARAERHAPRIARDQRTSVLIQLRDQERGRGSARGTEHPFHIGGHRQVAHALRAIADLQARDLDRVGQWHVLQQIQLDLVVVMFEAAVALPMARAIGGCAVADRQRRGAPQKPAVLIAQVDRLARGVHHVIVGPRRELIVATVERPGVAAALGRHMESKQWIGDHVDPGQRRGLSGPEQRQVFAPVTGEVVGAPVG